jgi:hypothetical protein
MMTSSLADFLIFVVLKLTGFGLTFILPLKIGVGVGAGVRVGLGLRVGLALGVGVELRVGVVLGVGEDGVGEAVGVGVGVTGSRYSRALLFNESTTNISEPVSNASCPCDVSVTAFA